jgi:hypothetical protein
MEPEENTGAGAGTPEVGATGESESGDHEEYAQDEPGTAHVPAKRVGSAPEA